MKEKNGATFLMALGFFLMAISPLLGNKYPHIATGLFCIGVGYYQLKKKQ
ncbi:hypothetical protein [Streptococcus iniae]|nr:hypothetical protein [Streptococcus iniae]AGM99166.1 hypothetical protein K710_1403 [Streptococcus iniae SF1]EKB51616.1 hypothetical protein A0G_1522 [Streptococcus iniae 9117]ESR09358.1 hypothetical protein IUSA1_07205 [Streptococcus iniae IUSA1]ATX40073.1 hypothetical protein CTW00_01898 [Streptococcus iniae]ELY5749774.1 hypothetical protein [Streptococcus iniae]